MNARGFSVLELVVVIVLVGLLYAVALQRYFSTVDGASLARLETLAGAMQEAAALAKSQWVAKGKPNSVTLAGGYLVNLDPTVGFPVDDRDHPNDTVWNMGIGECRRVFAALLETKETATNSNSANVIRANDFYVRRVNGGGGSPDACVYYVVNEALIGSLPSNAGIDPRYSSLVYTPDDGRVVANFVP